MKSNILTSRALKLAIFGLAMGLPALSAQAQGAAPPLPKIFGEQEELDDDSREFDDTMKATKLYPSLDEMMKDERIFRPETGLDAEAVVRLRKRITDWEGKVEKLENEIKILENEVKIPRFKGNKGDKGNKQALEKKLRKRRSELASLEKRLDEYERKAQSEYDKLRNQPTQEQAAEIEKVLENKRKRAEGNEKPFNPKYQGVPGSKPGKEIHRESLKLR